MLKHRDENGRERSGKCLNHSRSCILLPGTETGTRRPDGKTKPVLRDIGNGIFRTGTCRLRSGSGNFKSLTPSVASILAPGTTVAPHRRQSPSSASLSYMAMLVSDETMWQLIVWATSPMDGRDFGFSCKQHIAILASCRACRNHWQQLGPVRLKNLEESVRAWTVNFSHEQ